MSATVAATAGAREESGWLPGGGGWSLLCLPAAPRGAGCVLLPPLADERKSSLRPMVEIARALADVGITALRIDYRGTGDSSGRSLDTTLSSMVEDALAAADHIRKDLGCERVALAGLRLGGSVALLAAQRARADSVVVMEAVNDGAAYVRELRRRQTIRRMLTKGKGAAEGDENASGPFDLDGNALARAFVKEMEGLDLVETARGFSARKAARSLVLQVGPRRAASKANAALAEALGPDARLAVIRAEPFWLQTGYVDPAPATREIERFLVERFFGEALLGGLPSGGAGQGEERKLKKGAADG